LPPPSSSFEEPPSSLSFGSTIEKAYRLENHGFTLSESLQQQPPFLMNSTPSTKSLQEPDPSLLRFGEFRDGFGSGSRDIPPQNSCNQLIIQTPLLTQVLGSNQASYLVLLQNSIEPNISNIYQNLSPTSFQLQSILQFPSISFQNLLLVVQQGNAHSLLQNSLMALNF